MELYYGVKDKPKFGQVIVFALQQLLAIMAATIAVPAIITSKIDGVVMSQSAALFGAGAGTLVYLLFTKFKSPVFLGSSFAFLGSMFAAFAGAITVNIGFFGLILGAILAGLVYVILAIITKKVGIKWIDKLMPTVVIGPTVAIIGLSLSANAIGDLIAGGLSGASLDSNGNYIMSASYWLYIICGIITLLTTICVSIYGKKNLKMIPFVIGILAGYISASIFTAFGWIFNNEVLKVIDFTKFKEIEWIPTFTFVQAFKGFEEFNNASEFLAYLGTIAVAYVPVAFVVFAEHIADHKNLSTIINSDLLKDPGLDKTLLGDGVGSMVGSFFGGCPNTTYGESVGCVAISGNASIITIVVTAFMAMLISFFGPFSTFLSTIPSCVMGGVCVALYGFIAVSGLKMIQKVDLNDNKNLFVVSVILIAGVGGFSLSIGKVIITEVACALVLGIITNILCNIKGKKTK